jgi:O-antigen/teichoic acid export membrane protein
MDLSYQISLRQRVVKAGIWSLAGFAISSAVRLGSNLLLTRLLVPEMFGIMAIALTLIIGIAMFSDVGLKQNIVQSKRGHEAAFFNTAWSIQIVRGILIWFVALCVCILIIVAGRFHQISWGSVYAAPSFPYVLAALSFATVIDGFNSTKLFEASRSVLLGRITAIEIISQIAASTLMISWVLIDRSIWALVAGALCSSLVKAVLSHTWIPGTANYWQWDRSAAHEIMHFGKWIMISSILGFLVSSGDRLLLGGLVNSTILGFYAIASLLIGAVEGLLAKIMADVAFPAFSEVIRKGRTDLKRNYYRALFVIASLAYFTSGFLMTFGQSLINLLYDSRYTDAGWMLEVLAATLLTVPFRLAIQSFLALGMPKLQSHIMIVRAVSLFGLTPLGFYLFGLEGSLMAIVFSHFSSLPIIIFYSLKYHLFDSSKELCLLAIVPIGLVTGKMLAFIMGYYI